MFSIIEKMSIKEIEELLDGARTRWDPRDGDTPNFDSKTGKKLKETCDCWVFDKPFSCGYEKCPGIALKTDMAITLMREESKKSAKRIKGREIS